MAIFCLLATTASAYSPTDSPSATAFTFTPVPDIVYDGSVNSTRIADVPWENVPSTQHGLQTLYAVRIVNGVVNWAATINSQTRSVLRFIPYRYGYDNNSTERGYLAAEYRSYADGYSMFEISYRQYDGTNWHNVILYTISGQNYALTFNWVQAAYFYDATADMLCFTLSFSISMNGEEQRFLQPYSVKRTHDTGYVHTNLTPYVEIQNATFDTEYRPNVGISTAYPNGDYGTGTAQGLALSRAYYANSELLGQVQTLTTQLQSANEQITSLEHSLANNGAAKSLLNGLFGGVTTFLGTFLNLSIGGISVGSVLSVCIIGVIIYVVVRFIRG